MKVFNKLIRIMQRLRHPKKGCPWDLKQTDASLLEYVIEEAYELVEAIETNSLDDIKNELGDLLLQIVFLAQIQKERGHFTIRDVIVALTEKLVRRHPHIFAATAVKSAAEVKQNWEKIKMEERNKDSILSDYPEPMPALLTANRIAVQASSAGFDWNDAGQALEKVKEEMCELEREIKSGQHDQAEREIGDLLFAIANVARLLRINPEFALKRTNRKFIRRFRFIESRLKEQGRTLQESSLAEMEKLWHESKKEEKE